jgi:hypothetical protein
MSRAMRPMAVRSGAFGLALVALAMCGAAPSAQAGDLSGPGYGPAPYPAPNYGPPPVYERSAPCRIVLDRRIDPYGREVVHRMRVCDEGPMYPPVAAPVYPSAVGPAVAPPYGYPPPPPRYYEPQPSGYEGYPPRPPAPVGPGYYNN